MIPIHAKLYKHKKKKMSDAKRMRDELDDFFKSNPPLSPKDYETMITTKRYTRVTTTKTKTAPKTVTFTRKS